MKSKRWEVLKYFEENKEWMEQRVRSGIENHRKGDFCVTVVDAQGRPVPNARVRAELKNHAFDFGANIFMLDTLMDYSCDPEKYQGYFVKGFDLSRFTQYDAYNAKYKELFKGLFNLATLPFYWQDTEPEKGKFRYDQDEPHIHRRPPVSRCVEFCKENGIRMKAHCLNYDGCCGQWVKDLQTHQQVREALEERFRQCAQRYAQDIPGWEVTNETLVLYDQPAGRTKFYFEPDFVEWSFKKAREYFPHNRLIINDNHETVWQYFLHHRSAYYMQIKQELAQGTPIDSIGMQYHFFYPREEELKMAQKFYNPKFICEVMDLYGEFGLPMQITEVTIPSYSNDPEDEEIQAQLLKNLYSLWFSHPNMEAIVYWNLAEGYLGPVFDMQAGENYYHGGFLRKDFTCKPAYTAVHDLIFKQWHTCVTDRADEQGNVAFRGFYGDYGLEVTVGDRTVYETVTWTKDSSGKITVQLQG